MGTVTAIDGWESALRRHIQMARQSRQPFEPGVNDCVVMVRAILMDCLDLDILHGDDYAALVAAHPRLESSQVCVYLDRFQPIMPKTMGRLDVGYQASPDAIGGALFVGIGAGKAMTITHTTGRAGFRWCRDLDLAWRLTHGS